jgi:threonine dehydrogenase-like Zn-dependent dehydrogenase
MPKELVTLEGKTFRFREYELPPLAANEVRVQVEFAAPKHGTEAHLITGSALDSKVWDSELRLFRPRPERATPAPNAAPERTMGNIVVGSVSEIGSAVTRFRRGERVFGYGAIRQQHQAPEERWYSAAGLSNEDAVCADPAHVAFVAVRDGNIRIGDHVAIYGLGAIGLMAVQIARAGGARRVYAVDPIAIRRQCAERLGADLALDPSQGDAALAIKHATGNKGVDVAIETSGNGRALHDAIRCIRQCGTVVHVPWGPKDCSHLHLDEEFHLNRPTLIGSQAWSGWGNPDRSYPLWDWERAYNAAVDLLRDQLITGSGVVMPIVVFEQAPQALAMIFNQPEQTIKVGVTF